MTRPRLLDLFCGAGGAAMGYHRAGFNVVGVDNRRQPHYPFEFHRCDAIDFLLASMVHLEEGSLGGFSAIHASPPCQPFTRGQKLRRGAPSPKPDLVAQTRELLKASGLPWVIENVPGAPLRSPIVLCGSSFGLAVRRHRLFEMADPPALVPTCAHRAQGKPVGVYHTMGDQVQGIDHTTGRRVYGGRTAATVEEARAAMGIDWMTWAELREAIPPAYTEWIGAQLLRAIERAA